MAKVEPTLDENGLAPVNEAPAALPSTGQRVDAPTNAPWVLDASHWPNAPDELVVDVQKRWPKESGSCCWSQWDTERELSFSERKQSFTFFVFD